MYFYFIFLFIIFILFILFYLFIIFILFILFYLLLFILFYLLFLVYFILFIIFLNSKHVINSIVSIKWDLEKLICVTYKWAWVGPDISCILLTNNLTFNR